MVWYRWQIKILKCIKRAQEHPRLGAVIRRGASRYFRLRSTMYKGRQYSERKGSPGVTALRPLGPAVLLVKKK